MDLRDYIVTIEKKYENYFDIKKNIDFLGEDFSIFASFNVVNNRTLITKKDIIDSYESNEFCLVKGYEEVQLHEIEALGEILKSAVDEFVRPGRNHMSSYITGVIVTSKEAKKEVERYIRSFKCSKAYRFYFHGWSEIRLVLVDLARGEIITNMAGKKVKEVYQITP